MRRWPHLDGLRAVAALLVLVSHVGFWTGQSAHGFFGAVVARGDVGVAIFFALSAFLLTGAWQGASRERSSLRDYLARRAGRLLPGYAVVLCAVLVAAPWWGQGLGSARTVASHLLLLQGLTGESYQGFSQTWSLTTEVCFYLLLPVVGALFAWRRSRFSAPWPWWAAPTSVAVVGLLAHGLGASMSGVLSATVVGHGAWFATGVAALRIRTMSRPLRSQAPLDDAATLWLMCLVFFVLACTPLAGPRDLAPPTVWQAVTKEVLYAVVAGFALLAATTPQKSLLAHPWANTLGQWSYGIFLWHLLVLQGIFAITGRPLFSGLFWPVVTLVFTVTLALSGVMYRWVERPVINAVHARTSGRGPRAQERSPTPQ